MKKLTERQESELLERRDFGESRKSLIVDFGISEREYKKIILKHGGTLKSKVCKYNFNENYVIDWGSFTDIEKFYEFFYLNASVYLKRKKETFDRALDISKTKTRYRKK